MNGARQPSREALFSNLSHIKGTLGLERCRSAVRENILFRPAGKIQCSAGRQEFEAGGGHFCAAFAGEALFKFGFKPMQIKHVRCRIFELRGLSFSAAQSEDCCTFDSCTSRSSEQMSFSPWRSV